MQKDELYINGKLIDLGQDAELALTKQANNLGELQNRQGDFINTFTIPDNANNRLALENCAIMTSGSSIPYRKNTATYIKDGLPAITDGIATIKQAENGNVVADVVGGNVDFGKSIGNVVVGDLFTDDNPHTWNLTNAYNSRDGSEYYIYPFIDWRTDIDTFFDTPSADVRELLPCLRVPALFDRLETHTGLTFSGTYIDSDAHENMIITPDALTINPEYIDQEGSFAGGIQVPEGTLPFDGNVYDLDQGSGFITPTQFPITDCTINGTNFSQASFYPPSNVTGSLRFAATVESRASYPGNIPTIRQDREYWFVIQIKRGGTIIAEETLPRITPDIATFQSQIYKQVVNFQTDEQLLLSGQQYFVNVILNAERHSNADVQIRFGYKQGWKFEFIPSDKLLFGSEIRFRDLFRMDAFDIVQDVINLRGVVIQTNSYTKNVQFNFFSDLTDNIPNAKNWSKKVDVRQTLLAFKFGDYGQRNWFRFTPDDSVEDNLGDYYFDISDETLSSTVDVVQINHPATHQTAKYLGRNIPSIEGIDSGTNWQGQSHRVLQMQHQETSYNVAFTDGTTTINETEEIPFCKFEGFDFLISEYYETLRQILQDTKVIVLVLNLTAVDVHTLDFTIPIQLDVPEIDVNGYFYINKLTAYTGGLTSCEFVRL